MRPVHLMEDWLLNTELLKLAKARINSVPILVNIVSKRVRQLNSGFRPYVKPLSQDEEKIDIVLREINEGKLIAELDFSGKPEETHQPSPLDPE